jgi:hypothetical protein
MSLENIQIMDGRGGWIEEHSNVPSFVAQINPHLNWVSFKYGSSHFEEYPEINDQSFSDIEYGIGGLIGLRAGEVFNLISKGSYTSYIENLNLNEFNYGIEARCFIEIGTSSHRAGYPGDHYVNKIPYGFEIFLGYEINQFKIDNEYLTIPNISIGFRFVGNVVEHININ